MKATTCEICGDDCPRFRRTCVRCMGRYSEAETKQLLAWGERNPGQRCHRCDCDLLKIRDRDAFLCGDCMMEEADEQMEQEAREEREREERRIAKLRQELADLVDFEKPSPRRPMPYDLDELRRAAS